MLEQRYRNELEVEVNSKECREAFENLKREHGIFRVYPDSKALCDLLSVRNKNYQHKDKVMAILLTELRRSSTIYPLINLMFWDSLLNLYLRKRTVDRDQEDLFSRIQWDFYHSVIGHDLDRLPRKIDVNIYLNTMKRVTDWENRNRRERDSIEDLHDICESGLFPVDLRESEVHPEEMESYLLGMVYRKVINQKQYDLIVDTVVHKRMTQKEWAKQKGMATKTAKMLKYRAGIAMRQHEKKRRRQRKD
jgi:hypothetical protein